MIYLHVVWHLITITLINYIILFISTFVICESYFSQDTLEVNSIDRFYEEINYSFIDYSNAEFSQHYLKNITTKYLKSNVSGKFLFSFELRLDSTGNLLECNLLKVDSFDDQVKKLGLKIVELTKKSKPKFKNWVSLPDTSYYFDYAIVRIYFSKDPKIVEIDSKSYPNLYLINVVMVYKDEDLELVFDGFKNNATQSSRRLRQ